MTVLKLFTSKTNYSVKLYLYFCSYCFAYWCPVLGGVCCFAQIGLNYAGRKFLYLAYKI